MMWSLITCLLIAFPNLIHGQYLTYDQFHGQPYTVSYDAISLKINNQRSLFLSGSVHYPRSTPQMWPSILRQARADALNMVEIYTFWNLHERIEGQFDWSGNANLTKFLQDAADANLFVNLRVGPYVCAEWRYGGIPAWVGQKPGMTFREYNQIWMDASQKWLTRLIGQVRSFFADRGGPIVIAQIENELHTGSVPNAQQYIDWCGTTAAAFNIPVPWIMCNGDSANNTINSCNGNDCTSFIESNGQNGRVLIDQPALWTENEGWFQVWGQPYPDRYKINVDGWWPSREPFDMAYTVMRWFARGGSHMNYYMYHGGNHYSFWAGSGVTAWYANDVNLNSDGLPNEPKYSHLHRMHQVIIEFSATLLANSPQVNNRIPLLWYNNDTGKFEQGTQQYAWSFNTANGPVYWLENEFSGEIQVQFSNQPNTTYTLPPTSISIPTYNYDTYNVKAAPQKRQTDLIKFPQPLSWSSWAEPIPLPPSGPILTSTSPLEQLSVTYDNTSYIYYQHEFDITSSMNGALEFTGSASGAYMVFWQGNVTGLSIYSSTQFVISQGHTHNHVDISITIPNTVAQHIVVTILSSSYGVDNWMPSGTKAQDYEQGILNDAIVTYDGNPLVTDHTKWLSRPFLTGELLNVMNDGNITWTPRNPSSPLSRGISDSATWFRTTFPTPTIETSAVLLYEPDGMWRGEVYLNGHSLGHYWMVIAAANSLSSQSQYQIPLEWLTSDGSDNVLILHEEEGYQYDKNGNSTPGVDPSRFSFYQSYMVNA